MAPILSDNARDLLRVSQSSTANTHGSTISVKKPGEVNPSVIKRLVINSSDIYLSILAGANDVSLPTRLQSELTSLMMASTPGISAFPDSPEDLTKWTATIKGPSETPYENMSFRLSFDFPSDYPYKPPKVLFKTPIYHPNIDFSGRICLDILKEKWSAIYNVESVLLSLQSLLGEPNK